MITALYSLRSSLGILTAAEQFHALGGVEPLVVRSPK